MLFPEEQADLVGTTELTAGQQRHARFGPGPTQLPRCQLLFAEATFDIQTPSAHLRGGRNWRWPAAAGGAAMPGRRATRLRHLMPRRRRGPAGSSAWALTRGRPAAADPRASDRTAAARFARSRSTGTAWRRGPAGDRGGDAARHRLHLGDIRDLAPAEESRPTDRAAPAAKIAPECGNWGTGAGPGPAPPGAERRRGAELFGHGQELTKARPIRACRTLRLSDASCPWDE